MSASITVTVPIFTKTGEPLTDEQIESLGLVHLGDATIDVPVDFQQALPFDEIESALTGSGAPTKIDTSALEGPHSRACGVIPHQHGDRCHPNCPTCHGSTHLLASGDGSGVTVPDAPSPAPGPVAPEVADG